MDPDRLSWCISKTMSPNPRGQFFLHHFLQKNSITGRQQWVKNKVIISSTYGLLDYCSTSTDHPHVGALMSSETPNDMEPMKSFLVVRSQSQISMDRRRSLSEAFSLLRTQRQTVRSLILSQWSTEGPNSQPELLLMLHWKTEQLRRQRHCF